MTDVGIERHLDRLLKSDPASWRAYKRHLAGFFNLKESLPDFGVEEGDCFIRCWVTTDSLGLNKLFQIYELGELFPETEWRHIVRTGVSASLLQKPVSFLPAYAFGLDRTMTLLYWGQQQAFFDPERLRLLRLTNMLFTVQHPSSFVFSAANLAWPKTVDNILGGDKNISEVTKRYIFNSLFAPQLGGTQNQWSESPFIIVGDRRIDLYSVHKTICHVRQRLKNLGEFELVRADVLDNLFTSKQVTCTISSKSLQNLREGEILEILLTKHTIFSDSGTAETRISLFPFESTRLFRGDGQGILLTITSLVLRYLYLRSLDPVEVTSKITEIREMIASIFRTYPFNKFDWADVGSRIISNDSGLRLLIRLLGVYDASNAIRFWHPSLVEAAMSLQSDPKFLNSDSLRATLSYLSQILATTDTYSRASLRYKFEIQKRLIQILGIRLDLGAVTNLLGTLSAAAGSFIPLSKQLSQPQLIR